MNNTLSFKEKIKNADFIVVTFSTVFSSSVSFLATVFARRYVPPLEYGIYSTCLLLQNYMSYTQLGILNAYNRDYPQLLGAGEYEKSNRLKNTAFTFFNGCYFLCFVCIAFVISGLYVKGTMTGKYYFGCLTAMLVLIMNTVSDFGMNTMRMDGRYLYTACVTVVRTVAGCAVGLACIFYFGYYGLYALPVVSGIAAIMMYYKGVYKGIHFSIDKALLKYSLMSGMPLMINSLVWTAVASVDKFVILGYMDTEALGIYSVAQLGFSLMVLIPQSMSQVFYIKISVAYGRTKDTAELVWLCNRYTRINSLCTSAVCVAGCYVLPVFVRIIMPGYTDGISAAQIMMAGIAVYSSTMLYGNIFSVLKMNKDLLWTSVLLCIFNIVFSVGLVMAFGRELNNVAMGTAVSYAAFSGMLIIMLSKKFGIKIWEFCKNSCIPVAVMMIPTAVFYCMMENLFAAAIWSAIYVLFVLAWYWKKGAASI